LTASIDSTANIIGAYVEENSALALDNKHLKERLPHISLNKDLASVICAQRVKLLDWTKRYEELQQIQITEKAESIFYIL